MGYFAGIEPNDIDPDELHQCPECGCLTYSLVGFCMACLYLHECQEQAERESDLKREA